MDGWMDGWATLGVPKALREVVLGWIFPFFFKKFKIHNILIKTLKTNM